MGRFQYIFDGISQAADSNVVRSTTRLYTHGSCIGMPSIYTAYLTFLTTLQSMDHCNTVVVVFTCVTCLLVISESY